MGQLRWGTIRGQVARWARLWANLSRADVLAVLVLLAGVSVRLDWVLDSRVTPINDAAYYYRHAQELAAGHGYVHPQTGEPSAFLPPGYPILLAAVFAFTGPSVVAAGLLNVALAAAGLVLVYLIARRMFGAPAGVLALAAMAFFPSQVVYTPAVMPDSLLTTLVLGALYAALAGPPGRVSSVAAGLLLGAAVLTAPKAILLLPALPLVWRSGVPWPRSLRATALAGAAMLLVVLPWTIRSSVQLGAPVFVSTNSGVNLWAGNHEGASGGWEPWDDSTGGWVAPRDESTTDSEFLRSAAGYAASHPMETIALWPAKLREAFSQDFSYLGHFSLVPRDRPLDEELDRGELEQQVHLYYTMFMVAAVCGAVVLFAARHEGRVLAWPIAALLLPIPIFFGLDRYHVPLLPILAIVLAGGMATAAGTAREALNRFSRSAGGAPEPAGSEAAGR